MGEITRGELLALQQEISCKHGVHSKIGQWQHLSFQWGGSLFDKV